MTLPTPAMSGGLGTVPAHSNWFFYTAIRSLVRVRPRVAIAALSLCIALLFCGATLAQSGRGRPRVPGNNEAKSPASNSSVSVSVPDSTATVKKEQLGTLFRFTLHNGMNVIISEQHAYPVAATVAYFKMATPDAASALVARATANQIANEFGRTSDTPDQAFRALGGDADAWVAGNGAFFRAVVPSANIRGAIDAQGAMLQHPDFNAPGCANAFQLAGGETEIACLNPFTNALDRGSELALWGPAAPSVVATPDQAALQDFYRAQFRPDNLVIAVVGDIQPFDALIEIERAYGGFGLPPAPEAGVSMPAGDQSGAAGSAAQPSSGTGTVAGSAPVQASPPGQNPEPSRQKGLSFAQSEGAVSEGVVTLSYRVPGVDSDDWPAIFVLSQMLGGSPASVLSRNLVLDQRLATHVESSYLVEPDAGVLSFQIRTPAPLLDRTEVTVFKQLETLALDGPDAQTLARAKTIAEASLRDRLGRYSDKAVFLAVSAAAPDRFSPPAALISLIRAVHGEDIKYALLKYMSIENTCLYEYRPLGFPGRSPDAGALAHSIAGWAPSLDRHGDLSSPSTIRAGSTKFLEKLAEDPLASGDLESQQPMPIRDFSTLHGPKAFVREDHSQPKVTVAVLFQGGRMTETGDESGITETMLRVLLSGTQRMTRVETADALEALGARVQPIVQPDFFGYLMTAPSETAGKALKMIRNMIEAPAFRDEDVEAAKQLQSAAIVNYQDCARERAFDLMREAMYGSHPYGLPGHGIESAVEKLKTDVLKAWFEKTIKMQFPLIVVVGDTDGSALISEGVAGQFTRRNLTTSIKARVPAQPTGSQKSFSHSCHTAEQFVSLGGPKLQDPDLDAMWVIQTLLNGEGGTLQELVDQGTAWKADFGFRPLATAGIIYAEIQSPTEDQQRARDAFLSALHKLAARGPSQTQMDQATALASTQAIERLSDQQERALAYAEALFAGRDPSYVDKLADQLSKLPLATIRKVLTAYFNADNVSVGLAQGAPTTTPVK